MYFFPEMWDIMKTYSWCILDYVIQHKVDELFRFIRKIKPIICLLLQVQGFLHQTIISQLTTHLSKWKWNIPHSVSWAGQPDSSTALPDSLHRMTQSTSRQQMMDGLQMRLEKTTNEPTVFWPSWCNSDLFYPWPVKKMTKPATVK